MEKKVSGKIIYNADQFLIRTTFGNASTQGVFSYGYQLNILGWNNLTMSEQDPYSEVLRTNNHFLVNLMYTIARVWLGSYIQFPNSYSYTKGKNNTTFADDAFMNFSPTMKTYHFPDSGGSYLSRFQNDTSHIVLTIALEDITNYQSIYLIVILLDFMAYASHNISKIIHLKNKTVCQARQSFKKCIIKSANEYNLQFKYVNIFEAIIADVLIMPYICHHDDTILTYLSTPDIIESIGCSSVEYNRKTYKLSDMRARKIGIQNEYMKNVDTPVIRK